MAGSVRPLVLITGEIVHAHVLVERLREKYIIESGSAYSRAQLIDAFKNGGRLSETRGIMYTMKACPTGPMDREMIMALPKHVQVIANCGAGYDSIDIEAARSREIMVSNTPGVVDNATADTGLYLLLTVFRPLEEAAQRAKRGEWKKGLQPGRDPYGHHCGVLGLGGTGQAIAKRASALGMKIQYYQRHRAPKDVEESLGAVYKDLDDFLATSDVIILCVPLNPSTRNMVDQHFLSKCKRGVRMVNTARGGIVCSKSMQDALRSGQVAAYGTDVYPYEPEIPVEFLDEDIKDKLSLLPHVGTETVDTQKAMEELTLRNIEHAIDHGKVLNPVPGTD